jgi:hypothetical protein
MLYFYIVVSWVKSIPEKPHKGGKNMSFDDFDYESLRSDLMDNYGTAMCSGFPMAVMDLGRVERASESELLQIADREGYNLDKYKNDPWNR